MKTKLTTICIALLMGVSAWAQVPIVSIYDDCSKNGYKEGYDIQAVDLGLPSSIKWASCNVGAEKPEDYGNHYAWGEVIPQENYSWETYKYANGASDKLTKYCNDASYGDNGFTDNKTTLEPKDDAAHVNWGGSWRMPTDAEWAELIANCTWTWTTQNGINGYRVASETNSNSIFLPAAGYYYDGTKHDNVGSYGYYWSASLFENGAPLAWGVSFLSDNKLRTLGERYIGQSVRPVCPSAASLSDDNFATLTLYADGCEKANVITYHTGRKVEVHAVPTDENRRFTQWSDGDTDNPRTITLTEDITLTAKFHTNGIATDVEQTTDNQSVTAQKIIRNGQIYILRDDKMYTVTGEEVK